MSTPTTTTKDLHFKGYAIHSTDKYNQFKVIDFQPKTFGPYDIDIHVNVCGICSSDVHTLTGGWGEPILPLISGHEVAGTVVRVGEKVTEFKVGDRAGCGAQVCACFDCVNCNSDNENYCVTGGVDTYNAKYENGDIAHGGYSTGIRVHERFVFALPEGLSDEDAGPMLCGGLTVYAPLKNYGVKEGSKVAIIGIGGLGHFAVQFAAALGAEVTAISHSPDKKDDALAMGAKHYVSTKDKDWAKPHAMEFEMVLSTVDDAAGLEMTDLFSLLSLHGRLHSVGLPDAPVPQFQAQALAGNAATFSVSHIGNKKQANEMLKLAVEKGVKTWKEVMSMKDVGEGVESVKNNTVRYRKVLRQDIDQ